MSLCLRIAWWLLGFLVLLLVCGILAFQVATRPAHAQLPLVVGSKVTLRVDRLLDDRPRVSLRFNRRAPGDRRPELGNWATQRGETSLRFPSPGAPIRILLSVADGTAELEALPAGSYGITVDRSLVLYVEDGDPSRFQWPPAPVPVTLPAGRSTVTVTVLEAAPVLQGEVVKVVIEPPLTFKRGTGGALDSLWWLFFWPVYAVALGLVAMALLWASFRRKSVS